MDEEEEGAKKKDTKKKKNMDEDEEGSKKKDPKKKKNMDENEEEEGDKKKDSKKKKNLDEDEEGAKKKKKNEKTREEYEADIQKAREEGKQEALRQAREEAEAKAKAKAKDHDKKKKKKKFEKKLDAEVKKRLAKMPMCKGGKGGNGTADGKNRLGGTDVFKGKINATDAVGMVGFTNWSINEPPYKVERCDQILLIHGKKLNLNNYCEKTDAFMTMSIYMINFFHKKDVNKLIDSYSMADITSIPTELPGAPGCTSWTTKTKSFPFCYESKEVLEQIQAAYYKFLNCKNPRERDIAYELKKNCNLAKMNLTREGPFGEQGPLFREMLEAIDPSLFAGPKKQDLTGINPYYITDDKARVPGDHLQKPARNPMLENSRFP